MPQRPKKECAEPSCPKTIDHGQKYCDQHKFRLKEHEQRRGTSSERGYNSTWKKARDTYLKKHPFCEVCKKEGRLTWGTAVDHIVPVINGQQDPNLWNINNWESICQSCHSRKTAKENNWERRS
jgi:5-methylcytosine-specific restriction enzyme A